MILLTKLTVICILALCILCALYVFAIMPRVTHRPDTSALRKYYYAHRGLHDNASPAPENSMAAFRLAVESGFGIELDVQLTKDEVPVVFHDASLKRVCGVNQKLCDLTFEELQKYRLFDTDERIPRFSEVLALVNGQVPLIVELKLDTFSTRVCQLVDRQLSAYQGVYCVESFHPLAMYWYRKNRPWIVRGQLSTDYLRDGHHGFNPVTVSLGMLLFNWATRPDFVAYNCKFRHSVSRRLCRRLFHSIAVGWTIESIEELKQCSRSFDLFIFEGFNPKEVAHDTTRSGHAA